MRQLSELAHEYMAMGVLGPIQLIGRRRGEYPLVQDTITRLQWGRARAHGGSRGPGGPGDGECVLQ